MNKKYLKENNLYEAHKQFMRLCEWSYVPTTLDEDEDDIPQDPNAPNTPPNQNNQPNQNPIMGGQENQANEMPTDDGNPPVGGDMDFSGGDAPMDDVDLDGDMAQDVDLDGQNIGEDEDVIDVDDLTNAQEELNDKMNASTHELGQVDGKIASLLQALDNMENMLSNNNSQIENLKQEFEKRNPTQTEKLNLRSLDSYPFNVKPTDYWKEKGIDSNYSGYADNDQSTTKEYEVTNNDVDNFNEREIADSFAVDDDMEQNLQKIFGLK